MTAPGIRGLVQPFDYGSAFQLAQSGAQPAAGANFSRTIPGDRTVRLLSVIVSFATSAVVVNRLVFIRAYDPDGLRFWQVPAQAVHTASSSQTYMFFAGPVTASQPGLTNSVAGMPMIFIAPGWQWRIEVNSIDVGDQLSVIRFIEETFYDDEHNYPIGSVSAGVAQPGV